MKFLRNKKDVSDSYRKDLIKHKVIDSDSEHSDDQILDLLDKKVHETEDFQGISISSMDAFYHFCNYIIYEDFATGRKIWNSFIQEMFHLVEHNQYCCFMAARGHGKSFFWTLYSLFKAYTNPFFECIIASNTPKMGRRLFRVLNRLIESNEMLTKRRNPDNKRDISNNQEEMEYNHGFFEVTSVGTTPRSAHVNLAIADDPLRDDNRYSIETIENYMFGQLFPITKIKRGRMIISGTPMNYSDIFHSVMKDKKGKLIINGRLSEGEHKDFYCKAFPAILSHEEKTVLLPEVFTYQELLNIKEIQGELFFMREYMLQCIDEKKAIFPSSLIRRCSDNSIEFLYNGEENCNYVIGVDVATSGAASADYSAYVVLQVREKSKNDDTYISEKVVRHIHHCKGIDVKDQVDIIADLSYRFNNAPVLVEKNNVGVSLIQDLVRRNINVEGFVTDRFKKESAIRFLINEMQNGRMFFPEETLEIKALKEELKAFGIKIARGKEKMESVSGHDDLVDALWLANQMTLNYCSGLAFAICQD